MGLITHLVGSPSIDVGGDGVVPAADAHKGVAGHVQQVAQAPPGPSLLLQHRHGRPLPACRIQVRAPACNTANLMK